MMRHFYIRSSAGERKWHADTVEHAMEQHVDAFPDEPIEGLEGMGPCLSPKNPAMCRFKEPLEERG